ncbi:MAG TPA: MarR family transcriptional regulator [Kofleriaceae bacterium]|nr:MarR family transcriptional regulator [Kofleriaceae bacterium]
MAKATRRDLRTLLHLPQHDLSAQIDARLGRLGFPSLRPAHTQLLGLLEAGGVRLSDLVDQLGLPKQTVGDMVSDLEQLSLVERYPDPDHGVIKRVRLGAKGKLWSAEVKKVADSAEGAWAGRLGRTKMKTLRELLEQLAEVVEPPADSDAAAPTNGARRR